MSFGIVSVFSAERPRSRTLLSVTTLSTMVAALQYRKLHLKCFEETRVLSKHIAHIVTFADFVLPDLSLKQKLFHLRFLLYIFSAVCGSRMDPSQKNGSPSDIPASSGMDIGTGQTTSSALPFVTCSGLQWQVPKGVIVVPLNEQDPLKEYTRWNGQAIEVYQECCFNFTGSPLLQEEEIGC